MNLQLMSMHDRARRRASALAICLAAASATAATPAVLPPLNDPPAAQHLPGKFVWADLVAPDAVAARKFYGALFGWSFRKIDGGQGGARPYTLAYAGQRPVAGIIERRPEQRQAAGRWVAFMSVPDVARASAHVRESGGTILVEGRELPDRGEVAILADPDGVPIGVIKSSSGDQDDFLVDYGEWIWALYQSPAAERATAFFQSLGGYEVVVDDGRFAVPHFLLVAQGYSRASVLQIPGDNPRLQPGWLYFIRVDDVDAKVALAEQLGGSVPVPPRGDLLQGRLAVIADPGGAPVGLLEWAPDPEEGGT
ncbi:MAG: VOC family protein [Gammaproteobacteria bacterium]|nr:MAG: VOC family protein [Gammaproteobacteria bacterium]